MKSLFENFLWTYRGNFQEEAFGKMELRVNFVRITLMKKLFQENNPWKQFFEENFILSF